MERIVKVGGVDIFVCVLRVKDEFVVCKVILWRDFVKRKILVGSYIKLIDVVV